jgi:hypothetical protein
MKLNIKLSSVEATTFGTLVDQISDVDTNQLNNLATFIDVVKKNTMTKYTEINNNNNILQAVNYDRDENNNYWVILDMNLRFYDIGIPVTATIENNKLFESLSNDEIDIVSTILTSK